MDALASGGSDPIQAGASEDTYTVFVRGERFVLSHSQITFDSPNHFTSCFLSGFSESKTRTLVLDRNPALFALIVDYLSGYDILPLDPRSLPPTMNLTNATRNLRSDAQYFGLDGLCRLLQGPAHNAAAVCWAGPSPDAVTLESLSGPKLPASVLRPSDGSLVSANDRLPVVVRAHDLEFRVIRALTARGRFGEQTMSQFLKCEANVPPDIGEPRPSVLAHRPNDGRPLLSFPITPIHTPISIDGETHSISIFDHFGTYDHQLLFNPPSTVSRTFEAMLHARQNGQPCRVQDPRAFRDLQIHTYWADELLFCVPPSQRFPLGDWRDGAQLLSATLRSRPRVIVDSFSALSS